MSGGMTRAREEREEELSLDIARMVIASGGRMKRMDSDDLCALSKEADARGVTLAELKAAYVGRGTVRVP